MGKEAFLQTMDNKKINKLIYIGFVVLTCEQVLD